MHLVGSCGALNASMKVLKCPLSQLDGCGGDGNCLRTSTISLSLTTEQWSHGPLHLVKIKVPTLLFNARFPSLIAELLHVRFTLSALRRNIFIRLDYSRRYRCYRLFLNLQLK